MAEPELPDVSGKDSSEDQDVPSKCQDNVEDNVIEEKGHEKENENNETKGNVIDDGFTNEAEEQTDDEEYLMDQLEEAEEELKIWREKKRKRRTMRRDMDSSDEGQALLESEVQSDDEGPDDDDKKNDAIAFRTILKRLDASEEKFICDVCDEMLKTPASLSTHLMRAHKKLKCPECPKFLATQQSLRMHIFTHRPEIEWPYECEFCQKRFKMRSDVPKHFNSVLHRHDPDIPEKDTDEYYVILDRSFTKPDPADMLYVTKEDDLTVIECQGCENIFVPGPGYDEHIKECEIDDADSEGELEGTGKEKDSNAETQGDGDVDKREDPTTEHKDNVTLKVNNDVTPEISAEQTDEKKETLNEKEEDPDGEQERNEQKHKIGPASRIGRQPYKAKKRKMGPAKRIGRRRVGPKFLNKKPRLDLDKLSNLTRKCSFCDKIMKQLSHMVNHTLGHFSDEISKTLPTSQPYMCPTCNSEYKEKAPLIRHVAFTHRTILEHCKEEELKGRLFACESDDIIAPELPAVAKGKAAAKGKNAYKRTRSDDEFIDDPNSDYSNVSSESSTGSSDYEYNSRSGGSYSGSSGDTKASDSDAGDSVDYESGSEDEHDSDDYGIKKPPRALGWESD